MFQKFHENYKSTMAILAEYQYKSVHETVVLDIRKSSKLGCELYTEIFGNKYCLFSGLFRGCLKSLLLSLPSDTRIIIPHTLPIENKQGVSWLRLNEVLMLKPGPESTPEVSVFLTWESDGKEFNTNFYDIEEILAAVEELKERVSAYEVKIIKTCPFCMFINYYANTSLCLRDLDSNEYRDAQERMQNRMDINKYYEKVAWDIDEFHFCSAFRAE